MTTGESSNRGVDAGSDALQADASATSATRTGNLRVMPIRSTGFRDD
jgi:hypothetical protein